MYDSVERRPVIGVMGSARDPHEEIARPLGRWIAEAGYHLLTGGGGGVMAAVTRAFVEVVPRVGIALGILPGEVREEGGARIYRTPNGYPNRWVEVAVRTHLPLTGASGLDQRSRNHLNVLTSDVVIALPGFAGTATEVELALDYGRPLVVYDPEGMLSKLLERGGKCASSLMEVRELVVEALAASR